MKVNDTSTPAKRSRAKSPAVPAAINQTVLLRIEPRLKWTGSIDLVPLAGGGRTIRVLCSDSKLKLDLEWRGSQSSESAALIEAFDRIEAWVAETREQQRGSERNRLQTVIDQLRAHRRQLVTEGGATASSSIPETQAEAAAKEAAVDRETFDEWRERLKLVYDWRGTLFSAEPELLLELFHGGKTVPEAVEILDADSIDGEMDLRDDDEEEEDGPSPVPEASGLQEIPLDQIAASPLNPRQVFDESSLRDLAASIKTVGLLQPIVVYRSPGKTPGTRQDSAFEIIAGERRYRAAQIAAQPTVLCRVLDCTEQQAIELRVVENLKREDLNPIDEARGFSQMLDRCGYSQRSLAERLGVSQGHIGNRLGLLRLPEVWRQRVITGEITATMARELIPFAGDAAILQEIDEAWREDPETVKGEWDDQVHTASWRHSRPLAGDVRRPGPGFVYDRVGLSKKDLTREDLDVRELSRRHWDGKTRVEKRAFNVALWEELHAAGVARRQKAEAKKLEQLEQLDEKASSNGKSGQVSREEAKKREKQQREQWTKKLSRYKIGWLQRAIVERLSVGTDDPQRQRLLTRILLHFATVDQHSNRDRELKGLIADHGGQSRSMPQQTWRTGTWDTLATVPLEQMEGLAWDLVRAWIQGPVEGYHSDFSPHEIESLAEELGIDFGKEWEVERSFLELHSKVQLFSLASGWKIDLHDDKRSEMIDALLERVAGRRGLAPKELVKLQGIRL